MHAFEARADSPHPGAPPDLLLPPLRPPPPEPREDTQAPVSPRSWRRRVTVGVVALAVLAAGAVLWARHRVAPLGCVTAPVDRGEEARPGVIPVSPPSLPAQVFSSGGLVGWNRCRPRHFLR
jgi:hypothetical protein